MPSMTHVTSLPITDSSPNLIELLKENPKELISASFFLTGTLTTLYTGTNLANVVAREILGLCKPWVFKNGMQPHYPCANKWQKLPFYGSASLALFTISLALSYGPATLEKIKSLQLFGKEKNSSEIEPKNRGIDLLALASHLAVMISSMSGGIVVNEFVGSLFTFSEVGVRQLSETCISKIVLESNETIVHNYCQTLINNGNAHLLATGLALTALGASLASSLLINRIHKLSNKHQND